MKRQAGPAGDRAPPLGLVGSAALFGLGALLLAVTTRVVIPALVAATGAEPVVLWFLAASAVVFGPLLATAGVLLRGERAESEAWSWSVRLRLRAMSGSDWIWSLAGMAAVGASTGCIAAVLAALGRTRVTLSFMALEPIRPGRYWILAAWLPFFALNVLGEELLWRGVVLPRQEASLGERAWLVNGIGWLLFHAAFPWQVLAMLVPITLILPWIAQRRRSTWPGIVIHAGFGGAGFLALAFGLT
jgi:CAAX protease family protein